MKPDPEDVASDSRLGDWYANTVMFGRTPTVLFVNERSYLSILVPFKPGASLLQRFRNRTCELIGTLVSESGRLRAEEMALREIRIGRTRSRRVLGVMNDFAFHVTYRDDYPSACGDYEHLSSLLWRIPCGPLKYEYPITEASRLLQEGADGVSV